MIDEIPRRPPRRAQRPAPPAPASNDLIPTVTGETFRALVLEAPGPVVVEFMSYGCAHCRELEPILQDVAAIVQSTVRAFRVNVATDPELATSYEIQSTPTLIMFLNGRGVSRADGPRPTVSNVLNLVTQPFER